MLAMFQPSEHKPVHSVAGDHQASQTGKA